MQDLAGQQLGNYQLIQLLGRGGYAEVYLGKHVRLDSQAAIKVLHFRMRVALSPVWFTLTLYECWILMYSRVFPSW